MDFNAVRAIVDEVVDALWMSDPREALFIRHPQLAGSCEPVSIAIAAVLEHRGFGQWVFVQASRPGEANGHAWLEWRGDDGETAFSIDATLQQMPGHVRPFVDEGSTPAAAEFTEVNYEGPIWEWPWLRTGIRPYTRVIDAMLKQLG